MSPKKTHEVANMSSYISHFLREIEGEMEVRHIVDVGAGQVCPFILFPLFLCFLLVGNIKNSSLREGERIPLNLVCRGRWGKFSVQDQCRPLAPPNNFVDTPSSLTAKMIEKNLTPVLSGFLDAHWDAEYD